jgi:LysM repeat protein
MNVRQPKWQSWLSKVVSSLLVLAVMAGAMPQAALAAAPAAPATATAACVQNYTVKSGDTVSSIADQFKVTVAELANENGLKDPYVIFVGQVLCIPGSTTTTTTSTSTTSKSGISITVDGIFMTIKVSSYTKRSVFIVKAQPGQRGGYAYIKMGRIKTDKNGSGSVTLKIPKKLRIFDYLQVCLKNATTDSVKCEYVTQ